MDKQLHFEFLSVGPDVEPYEDTYEDEIIEINELKEEVADYGKLV